MLNKTRIPLVPVVTVQKYIRLNYHWVSVGRVQTKSVFHWLPVGMLPGSCICCHACVGIVDVLELLILIRGNVVCTDSWSCCHGFVGLSPWIRIIDIVESCNCCYGFVAILAWIH